MLYSVLNSKQKQLHGHKSNKMRESTLLWIGSFEEKIDLSHIYLAVKFIYSEKATVSTAVKSKVKISQNFVAFSEYMNIT